MDDKNNYDIDGDNPKDNDEKNFDLGGDNLQDNHKDIDSDNTSTDETMINGFSGYEYGKTGAFSFQDGFEGGNNNNHSRGNYATEDDIKRIAREEIKRKEKRFPWFRTIALILLFSILSSVATMHFYKGNNTTSSTTQGQSITINATDDGNIENAVAAKAIPSVVGITTATVSTSIFEQSTYVEGVGSGVIVSEDGYILTNSHVVSDGNASSINVVFSDGDKIDASLIWFDDTLDLAVVKVEKTGLNVIEFGDSDKVQVGDKAIAIGNPLGLDLQSTLTSGVISGLGRSITLDTGTSMDGLIQTDAAINGGNSGGALLNAQGQLIGINTAKASSGEGIGFAIPVNIARTIVDEIISTGNFESVTIGISGVDLEIYEKYFEIDTGAEHGVAVMKVQEGSPAYNGGIKSGDIITKVGSTEIKSMNEIRKILIQYKIGDKVEVELVRDGKEQIVEIEFIEYDLDTTEQVQP